MAFAILLVILGVGFVIFIHELGHFLLAKWNDVKVEKFSIGFGPTLFGFRRGETEYVLAAVPLGGFVKMLGEGEGTDDEQARTTDPRAYPNKSVGARMAIISAGVIMNVLLGLVCFVYAYGHGMEEMPAIVGAVVPASPAYQAGMRPGDEIVAIDGRREVRYKTLLLKVSLSRRDQVLHFVVRRPAATGRSRWTSSRSARPRSIIPRSGSGRPPGSRSAPSWPRPGCRARRPIPGSSRSRRNPSSTPWRRPARPTASRPGCRTTRTTSGCWPPTSTGRSSMSSSGDRARRAMTGRSRSGSS